MKNPNEHIQLYYVNEGTFNNEGKFVKTPGTHPVATIALAWLMKSGGSPSTVARGIAICGKNEQFSRAEGRKWAIKRARMALYTQSSMFDFEDGGTTNHFWNCFIGQFPDYNGEICMKSESDAILTTNEKRLLDIYMDKIVSVLKSTDKAIKAADKTPKKSPAKKTKVRMTDLLFAKSNA
jgi:hypothetical protein